MPCGARQGPRGGGGIIRGAEHFTFPALPRAPPPASGHALPERAPNPWRPGSTRSRMASAGTAVSGAGQPRHDRAAANPHAVPAATARKAISAMSRWMRPLPGHRGARRVIGEERQAARRGRPHRVRR